MGTCVRVLCFIEKENKMKRFLSILLCLTMLLSTVAIFSSCSDLMNFVDPDEPDDTPSGGVTPPPQEPGKNVLEVSDETAAIDLTDYTLYYSGTSSTDSQNAAKQFAQDIGDATGLSVRTIRVNASTTFNSKQILVGVAGADATLTALSALDGHGWVITTVGEALVIAGTTQIFTNMAMDYFTEHYLNGAGGSEETAVLSINQEVVFNNASVVTLTADGKYCYEIVYSEILDDEEGWEHVIPGNHSGGNAVDTIDLPVRIAKNLDAYLYEFIPVKDSVKIESDINNHEREICVGLVDREACAEAMSQLDVTEYGVFVRDSKIIVGAWNDECMEEAFDLFKKVVSDSYYLDADNNANVVLPANYSTKQTNEELIGTDGERRWATDFPKPTGAGIQLAGTLSSGDNNLIYSYQGNGVTAAAFDTYCQKLVSQGYTLVQSNTLDSNKFATYKNTSTNVTLHVEYAAYANRDTMTTSYYLAPQYVQMFEPTLRITSAWLDDVTLPTTTLLNANQWQSINKVTDTMITQIDVDYSKNDKGCFFVITLEDGSFVVVDGSTNNNKVDDRLWEILNNLYVKAHGTAPTASKPIHIRAWLLTHEHGDHYTSTYHFFRDYGKKTNLKIDYLLSNFIDPQQDYNGMQASHYIYERLETLKSYHPGLQYIKVHTGQRFYMQNVCFEILYTHENIAPRRQHFSNDTSTVFKTIIYNTNGSGTKYNESVFTILGDASLIASTYMRGNYSVDTLNCDLVQIGHHGGFGCEKELYDLMSPTATFWTLDATTIENVCAESNRNNKSLEYPTGYHVMHKLKGHLYAFIAEGYATTVTITKNGAQYAASSLYDANYGHTESGAYNITYDNEYVIDVYDKYGSR